MIIIVSIYVLFGFVGLLGTLLILIWKYLSPIERVSVVVFAVLLLSAPFAQKQFSKYSNLVTGPYISILEINSGFDIKEKVAKIKAHLQEKPNDHIALFSLAVAEKAAGRNNEARLILERIIAAHRGFEKAYINLANIQYANRNTEAAIALYKRLLQQDANSFFAHYNLGKIYYSDAQLEPGNQALRKAKRVNPPLFEKLEGIYKRYNLAGDHLFDAQITWRDIAAGAFTATRETISAGLMNKVYTFMAVLLLLIPYTVWLRRSKLTIACSKCGNVSQLTDDSYNASEMCSPCYNIYIKKLTIDPELKIRKERQIRGYQNRHALIAKSLSILLPGSGHLYIKKDILGIVGVTTTLAFVTFFLPIPTAVKPYNLQIFSGLTVTLATIFFVVFYVLINLHLFRKQ